MRYWILNTFWSVFICSVFFVCSGCAGFLHKFNEKFGEKFIENENLPRLSDVKILSDVSSVAFEWDMPKVDENNVLQTADIQGYVIYRADEDSLKKATVSKNSLPLNAFTQIAKLTNPLITHFYDSNLKPKSTYYYMFATLGEKKTISKKSKAFRVQTSFIDAVEEVFVSNTKPRTLKLVITPHSNPSVRSYIIERQNKDGKFVVIGELKDRLHIEFFDVGLEDATNYTYRVFAKDFLGNISEPSAEINARTIEILDSIENASASNGLPLKIELNWEQNPKAKHYKISVDSENDGRYKLLATTTDTSFTHTLTEHGKTLRYQIVAVDSFGIDGQMLKNPLIGSTLSRPESPKITAHRVQGNQLIIEWSIPSDGRTKKYAIYRKELQTNRSNRYNNIKSQIFIDKETKRGVSYVYSVASIDEFGIESLQSAAVTLKRD